MTFVRHCEGDTTEAICDSKLYSRVFQSKVRASCDALIQKSEDKELQSPLIFTLRHLPVQCSDDYDGHDDKEKAGNHSFTEYPPYYLASDDDTDDKEGS